MDRFQKFSVYLLIILSTTVGFELINIHATSSPTRNSICEPGGCATSVGACTDAIFLDGTTPVDHPLTGTSSTVGTAGQEMGAFLTSVVAANKVYCFEPTTYTWNTAFAELSGDSFVGGPGVIINTNNANFKLFTATSVKNVWITGFTLVSTLTSLVSCTDCSNIHVTKNKIDATGTGSVIVSVSFVGDNQTWFTENTCIKIAACPYFTQDAANYAGQNHLILDNYIQGATDTPIRDDGQFATIEGNSLDCSTLACASNANGIEANGRDITVTGNTITNIQGHGVWIFCVRDNFYPQNIVISSNTFRSVGDAVFGVDVGSPACIRADGVNIIGNVIQSTVNDGIFIQGNSTNLTKRVQIVDNVLNNTATGGSTNNAAIRVNQIGGQKMIIKNNLILQSGTTRGIIDQCVNTGTNCSTNLDIEGNTLLGSGTAILLGPNGGGAACTSCIVQGNSGYNPFGQKTNPQTGSFIGICGNANVWTASTDYTVCESGIYITVQGGTGVSVTVKDQNGVSVDALGATVLPAFFIPVGWKVNYGAFSVAPNVAVFAI